MAKLTKAEEAELAALEAEEQAAAAKKPSALTPEEEAELAALEAEEQDALGAGLVGAQQGLTFGFADEAKAARDAALLKLAGDPESLKELYARNLPEYRQEVEAAKESPAFIAGQLAGGVVSPVKLPGGLIAQGAAQGAIQSAGEQEGPLDIAQLAKSAALGGGLGGALGAIGKGIAAIPGAAKKGAEKLAMKATGATGPQAAQFAEGAGRRLLDEGVVRFGDDVEAILQRASGMKSAAGDEIGAILQKADEQGISVSSDDLISAITARAKELAKDPSQAPAAKQLLAIAEDVAGAKQPQMALSAVEEAKRGFQGRANYANPEGTVAVKEAGRVFREATEKALPQDKYAPFMALKKKVGFLEPVVEAAEKRALQEQQAKLLGFRDLVAGGAGAAALGPVGAVAAPALNRAIQARGAASAAVTLDLIPRSVEGIKAALPKLAQANPQLAAELSAAVKLPKQQAVKALVPLLTAFGDAFEEGRYPSEIDGKLYSEEDREAHRDVIKEQYAKDPIARAKALSALNKEGLMIEEDDLIAAQERVAETQADLMQSMLEDESSPYETEYEEDEITPRKRSQY